MKSLLENLKILDFTSLLPGPYATLMLADMGADIIKINSKSREDIILTNSAKVNNKSANMLWLNRNKKTISLNLKKKKSVDIIKKMIMEYDIVIESFTPGVMRKFGLSYEELKCVNPKIIYCSISSYGQTGSLKQYSGHDINLLAKSGISYMSGTPKLISTPIGGLAASNNAVIGILSAVNYRNFTGKGQHIDISILDLLINYNALEANEYLITNYNKKPASSLLNGGSLYDYYETNDNRYIAFGAIEPGFFKRFCEIMGLEELIDEGVFPDDVNTAKFKLKELFKSKNYNYWINLFEKENICITGVENLEEVLNGNFVKERKSTINLEGINQLALPIKFSDFNPEYKFTGKEIGTDTYKILKYFGYKDSEIEDFKREDIFK